MWNPWASKKMTLRIVPHKWDDMLREHPWRYLGWAYVRALIFVAVFVGVIVAGAVL